MRGLREALFQSVITHYYTFIHTGCKVPWVLRRLFVVTNSISFAMPQAAWLIHSVAPPRPKKSTTFRGPHWGVRSLRRPLLTKAKMSATFLMVSPPARICSASTSSCSRCPQTLFPKVRGHRNSPNKRECAVSITSVSRSFAVYIRTSNGFYSTCRHSSGMSSGTYVHGESP